MLNVLWCRLRVSSTGTCMNTRTSSTSPSISTLNSACQVTVIVVVVVVVMVVVVIVAVVVVVIIMVVAAVVVMINDKDSTNTSRTF